MFVYFLVLFRIIPVLPNLLPAHGGVDVFAIDATGTIVRWWRSVQTNVGKLSSKYYTVHL